MKVHMRSGLANLCLSILLMTVALGTSVLRAQETGGTISGVVTDQSNSLIPGASVKMTENSTGREFTVKSGSDGQYISRNLPPGRYTVRFEMEGFAPGEVPDVIVQLGRTAKIDSKLKVGTLSQAVTVVGEAPLIDLQSVSVGHNVSSEEFDRLPKARNFQSLLTTSPSVTSGQDQFGNIVGPEGGIQVNGASSAENQFFVDGVATNSQVYGQSRQNAPFEFLSEVQIKTAGTEAEYGGALGGTLSAVTKSGTNQFHGDLHYYFTGNGLATSPVKRLLSPLTVGEANFTALPGSSGGFVEDHKQKDNRNELGGSLGGPLWKDKAWFFISASPTWRRREQLYIVNDGSDTVQNRRFEQQAFGKISFDPNQSIRTNFTVLWTPTASTGNIASYNTGPNGLSTSVQALQTRKQDGFYAPQVSYTGSVDFTLSPKMLLTIKGGRFWDNYGVSGIPNITTWEYGNSTSELSPAVQATLPSNLIGGFGFSNSPRQKLIDHDLISRTFFNGDLSVNANMAGDHDLKIGWGMSKAVNNVDNAYPKGGYITAFWGQTYTSQVPGSPCSTGCTGTYGYYTLDDNGTRGSTGGTIQSIYGQDKWRIHPRVTLSLGVRFENEKVPSFRRAVLDPAFQFNFTDKIMPRLGVAYDVLGNGKLKASFGWGRFYDWIKYELARGTFGGDIWTTKYRALNTFDLSSLNAGNLPGRDLWDERSPNSYQDHRIPAFSKDCTADNLATCQVDPSLKPMGTNQMSGTVEYQFGPKTVLRVSYNRNSLLHAIEDMGVLIDGSESYLYVNPGEGLLGKVMNLNNSLSKAPADLCQKKLSGQNLTDCLAGIVFPTPKAERTYNALEISLTRRFSDNWFFDGSYVYSRLRGNYGGLSNSDEIRTPTTGGGYALGQQQNTQITRGGTSAGRAWDLDQFMFDSTGNPYVIGPLGTDRPHQLKIYGSYNFKFGTELGTFFQAMSGTPTTTYAYTTNRVRMLINDRGDLGRTPVLNQTDLVVSHTLNLTEHKKLRFEFNMVNLFNQKTARHIYNCLNYDCVNGLVAASMNLGKITVTPDAAHGGGAPVVVAPEVNLFSGFDPEARIRLSTNGIAKYGVPGVRDPVAGAADPFDPRYKKADLFNPGFQARVGVKFTF